MEFTIGELAARSGVATPVLRHWEDVGLLSPDRRVAGRRVYGPRGRRRPIPFVRPRGLHGVWMPLRRCMRAGRPEQPAATITGVT